MSLSIMTSSSNAERRHRRRGQYHRASLAGIRAISRSVTFAPMKMPSARSSISVSPEDLRPHQERRDKQRERDQGCEFFGGAHHATPVALAMAARAFGNENGM